MGRMRNESDSAIGGFLRIVTVFLATLTVVASTGCVARTLTITQQDYINTGMGRATGEPLEVAVVCVYPKDLKNKVNDKLKPGVGITAKEWFEREPGSDGGGQPFSISPEQIYLLTDRKGASGINRGGLLHGAADKGIKQVQIPRIRFKWWNLHRNNSVIYVFPRFIGPDGKVLAVKPAMFNPPGRYRSKLFCEIGAKSNTPEGQYIK